MLYFLHISLKPVCLSHPECFYLTLDWGLATASTWGQAYPFDRWPPSAVASDCSPGNVRHRHVEGWRPATMLFLTTCIQVWMVSSTIHILNTFAITPKKNNTWRVAELMSHYFSNKHRSFQKLFLKLFQQVGSWWKPFLGNAEEDRCIYDGWRQLSAHILVDKLRFSLSLFLLSW